MKARLAFLSSFVLAAAHPAFAQTPAAMGAEARSSAQSALESARNLLQSEPNTPLEGRSPGEKSVWISVGSSDLNAVLAEFTSLSTLRTASSERSSVYQVPESQLAELGEFMHEQTQRCGGFFAHASQEEALKDLSPTPVSRFENTLDREATVRPMVSLVREAGLRGTIASLSAFPSRYYQAPSGVQAAQWIRDRWAALSASRSDVTVALRPHANWAQPSVVATVRGSSRPDEIIVLGGHLDSISGFGGGGSAPGADDNASGISVLTEALRVLVDSGYRPERTIQFIGYAAEEVGLRGSAEIARDYRNQNLQVLGVAQFDMTNFAGSGERIFLVDDFTNPDQNLFMGRLIDSYVGIPWSTMSCGYACSDHASWHRVGYPASTPFESAKNAMNRNIHTPRDTIEVSGGNANHAVHFAKLAVAFMVESAKGSLTERARN